MSKFTPGPWELSEGPDTHVVGVKNDDSFIIAQVFRPEREANARLIAAAPELLAAAQRALAELKSRDDDSLAFARMGLSLAIEKATGGAE